MKPLNPIMAALLAAVSATLASPRLAFATPAAGTAAVQTPRAKPAGDATPDDFTALAALLKTSGPAKAGVSARVQKYVLDDKLKFANDAARGSAEVKKEVAAETDHWISTAPANAAHLFYVLSFTQPAPDWAKGDATLQKMFGGGDTRDLKACLDDRLTKGSQSQVGKIAATRGVSRAVGNFLIAAGTEADNVLLDCDQTQRRLAEKDIKDKQDGPSAPTVPGTGLGNGGNGQPDPLATNKSYGMDDLYVQGAKVAYVYRDAQDGYRLLSIKLYSIPQPNGGVKNELGIVDITGYDPNRNPPRIPRVFSPTFVPLPLSGKTSVTVYGVKDDGGTVTRNYDLLGTGYGTGPITLSRPGSTPGAPGSTAFVVDGTMAGEDGLLQKRAKQATTQGTTMIGNKSYYVLGQGGTSGTFLFFDTSSKQLAFVSGDVNVVDGSGNWGRNTSNPSLNPVGPQDDPNAQWHLEWVGGHWTVVAGPAVPPAQPPSTSTTTAPGGPPANNPAATTSATNTGGTPCANATCVNYTDRFTGRDANADFSDASKRRVYLLRDKDKATDYYIQFARDEVKGGTKMLTFNAKQVPGLVGIRGYQDAFALEIKKDGKFEVQYLPIDKVVANFNTGAPITPFDDFDTNTVKSASNFAVVRDMLTYYYSGTFKNDKGVAVAKETAIEEIAARAKKRIAALGGKTYTVGGAIGVPGTPLFIASDTNWEIWPGDKAMGGGGARPGDANLVGPGAVGDIATSGDAPMPAGSLDIGGGVNVSRKDKQNGADIGLYESDDGKDWYMFLRVARDGGTSRTGAIKLGGPIGQWMKNPAGVGLQGIASIKPPLPINAPPMQFIGTATKGAYVIYRYVVPASDGSNIKDKPANCAGAVIWYGTDAATAQQACVKGHF